MYSHILSCFVVCGFLIAAHSTFPSRFSEERQDFVIPEGDFNEISNPEDITIVKTSTGKVQGSRVGVFKNEVLAFQGIPYAEPPIGDLRFQKTVAKKPWMGMLDATRAAPHCPQASFSKSWYYIINKKTEAYSEDCLTLNIWTPVSTVVQKKLRPVIFLVIGGNFGSGFAASDYYDGKILSSVSDAVVVTFNYRLDSLGWLNLDSDEAPGNQALYDVVTALQWVKENAEQFGGDANNLAVVGQSNAAYMVSWIAGSPTYGHLIKRAIMQSFVPIYPGQVDRFIAQSAMKLAKQADCDFGFDDEAFYENHEQVVECLKSKNIQDLLVNEDADPETHFIPFHTPNEDFPMSPYEQSVNGTIPNQIESLAIGFNKDELTFALPYTVPEYFSFKMPPMNLPEITKLSDFKDFVVKLAEEKAAKLGKADKFKNGSPEQHERAFDIIIGKEPEVEPNVMAFLMRIVKNVNRLLTCDIKYYADDLIKRSDNPDSSVYMYQFSQTTLDFDPWMGATHGAEVSFLFGKPLIEPDQHSHLDIELSKRLMKSFATFAETGKMIRQLDTEWKQYNEDGQFVFEFKGGKAGSLINKDEKMCEIINLILDLAA